MVNGKGGMFWVVAHNEIEQISYRTACNLELGFTFSRSSEGCHPVHFPIRVRRKTPDDKSQLHKKEQGAEL